MRFALFLALALTLPALVSAQYADLTFDIAETGVVTTSGVTDAASLPLGESSVYTAKKGEYWTFNVTSAEVLETFVYEVRLPEGAAINYLNGKGARITTDNGAVVVKGAGENAPLAVTVQYSITGAQKNRFGWIPLVVLLLLLGALWFVLRGQKIRMKRERKTLAATKIQAQTPSYLEGIPARQQAIVQLLRGAGGTLTQRQIELTLKLPKSSVSRNVEALRRRGIVEKAQLGMTNTVVLGERYR
jgi:uncharacterized membrane protein